MSNSFDVLAGSYTTYMAAQMWKVDEWANMMVESFKGADHDRDYLSKNGSWLGRTGNIHTYLIDIYA